MYLEKCESKDSLSQIGCKDTTKIAYMQIFLHFSIYLEIYLEEENRVLREEKRLNRGCSFPYDVVDE